MSPRSSSAAAWCEAGVRPGVRKPGEVPRWERCVYHRAGEVRQFAEEYFSERHRRILLIGGAGFDPRSLTVAHMLSTVASGRVDGVFLRERRSLAEPPLTIRARRNESLLLELLAGARVVDVPVFANDGAVTLGRVAAAEVNRIPLADYSDVVLDFSALSTGASFPIARLLMERIDRDDLPVNLHAMVTSSPGTDSRIVPIPGPVVGPVHGFPGGLGLDGATRAAKLWMPQLRRGYRPVLDRIHDVLRPDDVVPVLPFPSQDPREGDRLIEHFANQLNAWEVDSRNIVYSDETNPLDFYLTVLRIHDRRTPVFSSTVDSLLVLSPVGSKVLALGALMAAAERNLPVVYVEAAGYETDLEETLDVTHGESDIVHVWLLGDVIPRVRTS